MSSSVFFLCFVPILSLILLSVNFILAPHMPYKEKKTPFECGYHSFLWQNRTQFTISFFSVAIVFLLLDLEIVLINPYVVSSYTNNIFGLVTMILFTLIVTIGFTYELGKKALKIESKQTLYTENSKMREYGFGPGKDQLKLASVFAFN
jgi:NADH-ubiquinone oxidoreductase chain 3